MNADTEVAVAAESPTKKQKLTGPLIGTHNGHFHADEALAVFLLRLLPTYASSPLVRTRDPSLLSTCHTVVDVGGEYSVDTNRYDHHQRDFSTTFPARSTKLSSAGLVYKHFGHAIIAQQTGLDAGSPDVNVLYEKIYDDFIEAFDANDNGISAYDSKALSAAGIIKRFEDRGFSIASVVGRYNHERSTASSESEPQEEKSKEQKQAEEDARFLKASAFTGQQFLAELTDKHLSWLPARTIVRQCYADRQQWDPAGRIMVLPHRNDGLPWSDHLYTAESEAQAAAGGEYPSHFQVLYVLFPESGDADSKWRIRAVSVENGGFQNRKDLPDAWKGVRDEELDRASGISGCVFVHMGGFIGGNKTFEGALEMARKAVEV
ncbi:MYG1 protein-like protein [Aulographum hederae CBS 113979]|uniref:MYG1 protein-like protein n=1 Tax=Aulographum hederae CBS 113979 TaxID=1176131 RepID=A0A6G1H3S1_9PEZI|nr:MYG1 protein-like protein [Aulographum hederae CBS 113979]